MKAVYLLKERGDIDQVERFYGKDRILSVDTNRGEVTVEDTEKAVELADAFLDVERRME